MYYNYIKDRFMIVTFNCTKFDFIVWFSHVNLGKEILFLPIYSPNDMFNN